MFYGAKLRRKRTGEPVTVLSASGRQILTNRGTFDISELEDLKKEVRSQRMTHSTGPTNQMRTVNVPKSRK